MTAHGRGAPYRLSAVETDSIGVASTIEGIRGGKNGGPALKSRLSGGRLVGFGMMDSVGSVRFHLVYFTANRHQTTWFKIVSIGKIGFRTLYLTQI